VALTLPENRTTGGPFQVSLHKGISTEEELEIHEWHRAMVPVGLERFSERFYMARLLHWMYAGSIKKACQLAARVMLLPEGELEGKHKNSTSQTMSSPAVCGQQATETQAAMWEVPIRSGDVFIREAKHHERLLEKL